MWMPGAENTSGTDCHDNSGDVDDVNVEGHIAPTAFNMIIFQQFRHALTRHDRKT